MSPHNFRFRHSKGSLCDPVQIDGATEGTLYPGGGDEPAEFKPLLPEAEYFLHLLKPYAAVSFCVVLRWLSPSIPIMICSGNC